MSTRSKNDGASDRLNILMAMRERIGALMTLLKQQQALLNEDDVNAFIQSMEQNHGKLKEIEQLMQSLHESAAHVDSEALEDEITCALKELQTLEKETHALAVEKLDVYRKNIRDLRGAKKGIRSYLSPYSKTDGMYFDKTK